MYIPYQGQQIVHQEIVNDGLRRSRECRMLQELGTAPNNEPRVWKPALPLITLVRAMLGGMAR